MTNTTISQSQKRFSETIGALFHDNVEKSDYSCLIIKSSSDVGVMRNGGRSGARFAPQSFLATFKKLAQNSWIKKYHFTEAEVATQEEELKGFDQAQIAESEQIEKLINSHPDSRILHLGGGHDHIYPLLKAYARSYKKILVINVDAHADTRKDDNHHSGTPFRQFANDFAGEFSLFQIGLHPYSNSTSTLSPLKMGYTETLWSKDCQEEKLKHFFTTIHSRITPDTLVIFSLDADAMAGFEVPGVSAVNPAGLSRHELLSIWKKYRSLPFSHPTVLGLYELNPIYDTLSSLSMRTMASFVFESLE